MKAVLGGIEYYPPTRCLTNSELAEEFPEWSVEKIEQKAGISPRWLAGENECSSDLGIAAAQRLFQSGSCRPEDIDYIIFCTQSPDYFLPTSACIMQERLSLPTSTGALDFNLRCSGYIYGLGLAKALVETGQASQVPLVTAETYSKFVHPQETRVSGLSSAMRVLRRWCVQQPSIETIGPFVYGTDGAGAGNPIAPPGACGGVFRRQRMSLTMDIDGNVRSPSNLYMNGPEIFAFTLRTVPKAVGDLLKRRNRSGRHRSFRVSSGQPVHAASP
jgi:3-oxoacyl-[acyl-carrier-protein] synthase-3